MSLLGRLFRLRLAPREIKTLSVRMVVGEDQEFYLEFRKERSDAGASEFIRLMLHYYAMILHLMPPEDPNAADAARELIRLMDSVIGAGIGKNMNVLQAADINDVVTIVPNPPTNLPREMSAVLIFVSVPLRHIISDIPLKKVYLQHLVFSVFVVLQHVLSQIDDTGVKILAHSLEAMNSAYHSEASYSTIEGRSTVPNMAFNNTMFG